jgi:succinate dehydrogenase / fumarate reductase cytochrome b subunit
VVTTVTRPGQRRTPRAAKTSSVFKKVVMATTGIVLILFLIAHMIGNLHAFQGAKSFNEYSSYLRTLGNPAIGYRWFLTAMEVILTACILAHMWAAFSLWYQAKKARPVGYAGGRKAIQQTYASRTMRWGGVIVLAFIVYHLLDLSAGVVNPAGGNSTPFQRLIAGFTNPWVTAWYVIALLLLGMHLRHGVWSATQTLGQSNKRRERTVNAFAVLFAVLLTAGFLVVPLSIAFGAIR